MLANSISFSLLPSNHSAYIINSASILYKSIAGRYRPVRVADGPITARYRFIKNAYWEHTTTVLIIMWWFTDEAEDPYADQAYTVDPPYLDLAYLE